MIAYMLDNKTVNPIATELFLRGRKLNILFLSHSFILLYQINIRLNSTHYFTMKIPNKQELRQVTFNHSSNNDECCTSKLYPFLVIDAILLLENPLRFRKILLEKNIKTNHGNW